MTATQAPIVAVVRPLDLAQHELEVELRLPAEATAKAGVLALPAWTPGSYLVRDYARLIDRVRLANGSGETLLTAKLDKQRWPLPASKSGLTLRYRVFGNELTVRTNHFDATHAQVIPAATFMVPEGQKDRPWEVRFEGFPEGWQVATGLESAKAGFAAPDFDTLVDSPFEVGAFRRHAFEEGGARFELVCWGQHNGDEARMAEGCRKVVLEAGKLFGGFPFKRYVFLLGFSPRTGGGLEHKTSTSLLSDPFRFEKAEGYYGLFNLMAHEFFHVWNVKHMHDPVLGPFDYGQENYTRLLWFHEGFTSYMEHALVLRAGVVPWSQTAKELGNQWTAQIQRPGRREQSLEESSFDAWIRQYKPNEFTPNSTVGYYDKGEAVGWLMDATIRVGSKGAKGLPDLFALLWTRRDGGITDAKVRAAFEEISGLKAAPFWDAYISGRAELDATPIEQAFGLKLELKAPWETLSPEEQKDPDAVARAKAWTGLQFANPGPTGDPATIQNVLPGSPAFAAGLSYGQEIVAVEGWRTTTATEVKKRLADVPVGAEAEVVTVDRGRLRPVRVKVAENPARTVRVVPNPLATAEQKAAFTAWTGQPHPPLSLPPRADKGK
jgi:predicted metalloprotease with PDZ domain